jgi:hypothetical protein
MDLISRDHAEGLAHAFAAYRVSSDRGDPPPELLRVSRILLRAQDAAGVTIIPADVMRLRLGKGVALSL